jgi:asparagine synthase (glutamine-hydrolysing)
MCGIAGNIYFDPARRIDSNILKKMTDSIFHRGPDDEGFYINDNVGLAFRRLSIIDLNTGHQPLSNQDENICIVFNGEIYNYLEQRELLLQKGYVFKTSTDTEVILYLYEEYGVDCLQYLRGMFAFAIWDNRIKQLFCARDRFGIKPFYYYKDSEKFVFGSEIKAILNADTINKSLSIDALDSYFAYGYITSDLSIYEKINKLLPGHYLTLSFKNPINFEIKKYWDIKFEPDYTKSEEHWKEALESCFSETVKLHMISDVPLGAFLSGGIDSSSVVAMMAKNSTLPIKTFSIGFKEQKYNELELARETALLYGCEHHERIIEPESMSLLPKLVSAYDEPFADSSAIPTYYVSKLAREFVTVALSGDGGDELFAGYDIYSYLRKIYSHPFNFNAPNLNEVIWGNLHKMYPHKMKGKGASYLLSKNKSQIGAYISIWTQNERKKLILGHLQNNITYRASEHYKEEILNRSTSKDFITNLQNLDLQTFLVDDILTKVDRVSMLNSLEVRVPILDHKFAELSFKIPRQLKMKDSMKKYIFRQSMAPYLTQNVLNHPKQGFSIPLSLWFKDDLKEYVNDVLLSNNSLISNYLDKFYVKKIIGENNTGMRDFSSRIWSLLFLEEWLKQSNSI